MAISSSWFLTEGLVLSVVLALEYTDGTTVRGVGRWCTALKKPCLTFCVTMNVKDL